MGEMSSKLGQGFVSSCVGPVVDISISTQKHEIYQLQALWVSLGISKNLGLPCIYDSLLLSRPECSFREGIRIQNRLTSKRRFYEEINKEESLVQGIMACNKLAYTKLKTSERQGIKNEILANSQGETAIGLASALILVKAYANWLLVEVNQICYGGIVRTIALGFTEGISSWKVEALCTFQPLVVPVGRSTLGRLFNVLGATIDAYMGIDELPIYAEYKASMRELSPISQIGSFERDSTAPQRHCANIKICTEEALTSRRKISHTKIAHIMKYLGKQFTYLKSNITEQTKSTAQKIQMEGIGLSCIMGMAAEIIG